MYALDDSDEVPQRKPLALSSITISQEKILSIIRSLDPNKSSGYDMISPHMINICDSAIVPPLQIIIESTKKSEKI